MEQSQMFEIRLKEQLSPDWAEWMNGMTVQHVAGHTVLSGWVRDQAELYGLIGRVRDLGLSIVALRRIDPPKEDGSV